MKETLSTAPKRWGMILYTILEDGNLQGIWTYSDKAGDNDTRPRQLFMEIARKEKLVGDTTVSRAQLAGNYDVVWVDEPADRGVIQSLTIGQNGTVYTFQWWTNSGVSFTGVGMRLGPTSATFLYCGVAQDFPDLCALLYSVR